MAVTRVTIALGFQSLPLAQNESGINATADKLHHFAVLSMA